jgi:hypothetical protein
MTCFDLIRSLSSGQKSKQKRLKLHSYYHTRVKENNNNVWKAVRRRCIDIERQDMEAKMRGKGSLTLYNELKNSWEREKYIDTCSFEERQGIV